MVLARTIPSPSFVPLLEKNRPRLDKNGKLRHEKCYFSCFDHRCHLGVSKYIERAHHYMFWLGIAAVIPEIVSNCNTNMPTNNRRRYLTFPGPKSAWT